MSIDAQYHAALERLLDRVLSTVEGAPVAVAQAAHAALALRIHVRDVAAAQEPLTSCAYCGAPTHSTCAPCRARGCMVYLCTDLGCNEQHEVRVHTTAAAAFDTVMNCAVCGFPFELHPEAFGLLPGADRRLSNCTPSDRGACTICDHGRVPCPKPHAFAPGPYVPPPE